MSRFRPNILLEFNPESNNRGKALPRIRSAADIADVFQSLKDLDREVMLSGALDAKGRLVHFRLLGLGSSDHLIVRIGDAFLGAIKRSATGIFLVHNHPSGSLKPSALDWTLTREVAKSGMLLGYPLFDHVIVSRNGEKSLLAAESLSGSGLPLVAAVLDTHAPGALRWTCPHCERQTQYNSTVMSITLARGVNIPETCHGCHEELWLHLPDSRTPAAASSSTSGRRSRSAESQRSITGVAAEPDDDR